MIRVVNKHRHTPTDHDIYIGRGSVFGNPYSHMDNTKAEHKVATREEAIEKYRQWFDYMRCNDVRFCDTLKRMRMAHRAGADINLVCYCAPKACHGDVIKEYLEEYKKEYLNYIERS